MAQFTVYPSANDVAVVTDEGRVGQEITHKEYAQTWVGGHFISGFTLPATTSGTLVIDVATGEAIIGGQRVQMGSIEQPTMAANQTNHIYLRLTFDGNSLVDGVQVISNTTGVQPSDSVKIGEAVTDATEVTSTFDSRIFHSDVTVSQQFGITRGFINQSSTTDALFVRGPIMRVFIPYAAKRARMLVNIARSAAGGQGEARLRVDDVNAVTNTGTTVASVGAGSTVVLEVDVSGFLKRFTGEYLELSIEFRQVSAGGGFTQDLDDDAVLTSLIDVHPAKFFATTQTGRD